MLRIIQNKINWRDRVRVSFFLRRCTFNGDYDQDVDKCICVALFVQTLISPSRWKNERERVTGMR